MNNKFLAFLRSRKFWAAFIGLPITSAKALDPNYPLDEAQIADSVLVTKIIGIGLDRPVLAT